jgi:ribose transport system ATP-binding protein
MSAPILEARQISKAYPGIQALHEVSLVLNAGETLAVIGENGAGKSTLMRILAGVEAPDSGSLIWHGEPFKLSGVQAAEKNGIVLIHQELNLAENLDIASSIFLGREPTWGGPLRLVNREIYGRADKLLQRIGLTLPSNTPVEALSVGQQQLVEIARALALESRVLIMDEPTSSLTESETQKLYEVIANLKSHGVGILYITHRLKEVERLADRVTVLRDGKNAGELSREAITPERLVRLMVGRDLKQLHHRQHRIDAQLPSHARPVLQLRQVRWSDQQPAEGISFAVYPEEILGLAGLVGAGRTELAEVIFGVRPLLAGSLELDGKPYFPSNARAAIRSGLFLVPEDRRQQGLVLGESICRNISLASLDLFQLGRFVARRRELEVAEQKAEQLHIRSRSLHQAVELLSGGNQQKVVLAKGLVRETKLLILDEPTRGVDVGAKAELYALMDRLAKQRVGILMISSDMEEVLGMSDRVVVLHEGQLAGELQGSQLTEEAVMHLATGSSAAA